MAASCVPELVSSVPARYRLGVRTAEQEDGLAALGTGGRLSPPGQRAVCIAKAFSTLAGVWFKSRFAGFTPAICILEGSGQS